MSRVDIIIVNWNSGGQLRQCLASIERECPAASVGRIVVVDNASVDDSLSGISSTGVELPVIRNLENRGFAAACNQGAAQCRAEYLLFLNPDTRLYQGSLEKPLRFFDEAGAADVGICGIQLVDEAQRVARTCSRFPTPAMQVCRALGLAHLLPGLPRQDMAEWDHQSTRRVDQVMGAFFLVRRKLFEQLGGFDDRFFVYFEEVDFSLRARAAGWRTVYLAAAQAYHRGCGTSERVKARRLFYNLRSRLLYAAKHFTRPATAMVAISTLAIEPWTRLAYAAARLALDEIFATIAGYGLLWADSFNIVATAQRAYGVSDHQR